MSASSHTMPFLAVAALLVAPLAGCDKGAQTGTTAGDERVSIKAADGRMAIDLPGFDADIRMPAIKLTPDMLKLDGTALYPGTTVAGFDVAGTTKDTGTKSNGTVTVAFAAPAPVDTLRTYYHDMFQKAGYTLTDQPNALSGRKPDGTAVQLTLAPAASGSTGKLVIGS
ncbi:hypothetical protein [Sphingomonas prati]|uniref:Uncharacterized protein n=1 Tax=Sphingomonas prati TaxID=1843237 RepID=A0A7W9BQ71_9SPHN|nr:hypothetical protein [Sphingomonas prati]MBB5728082.1 hypothetical protein [Sphingomonas prati]GGE83107.1 hypothetical protein GCM10011404_14770 [Sphingomonas prati]